MNLSSCRGCRWAIWGAASLLLWSGIVAECVAGDWPRFLGPNGTGVSTDEKSPPTTWSETENIRWKRPLPGPGVSCPIVVGDKIFVTCYSGYGTRGDDDGEMENLKRHLLCVARETGEVLWEKTVPAVLPEDPYRPPGVTSHGYASHTPVSDGERVYAFFGKTGVIAFDMQGNQLWQTSVGTESGEQRWGSAASPIVHEDLVIVNASDEAESLVALDKRTGEEKWTSKAGGLASTWGTPAMIVSPDGVDLVLSVPGEVWGFNPETGKLRWYAPGQSDQSVSNSLVPGDGVVYVMGGRGNSAVAVKLGGKGDLADNVLWEGQAAGRFGTPVLYEGHIYVVNGGVVSCHKADSGQRVFQERLATAAQQDAPGGGGGRRGGGGFGRGQDYASPVVAGGKVYITTKTGNIHVIEAKPEFQQLATNDMTFDTSGFDATPAVSNGQLFLRSNSTLYCIGE
ncbi:MAG: PQQ-binding-like beta-propeller repeat protein [Pirellulaceae bacterium]|nr:PQQ-like beta-propeller repeat protein [Planctomycetales bacterium]